LALAYQDQGSFALAQHAYEHQSICWNDCQTTSKITPWFWTTLGTLSRHGRPENRRQDKNKALHLYEKIDDHTGMAIASSDLAGLALSQKRVRDGRKYLGQS